MLARVLWGHVRFLRPFPPPPERDTTPPCQQTEMIIEPRNALEQLLLDERVQVSLV